MVRHLFKMIWNRKKQNFLMITEIFVSFLVLFAVFTLVVYNIRNYMRPMGFEYGNVWNITFSLEAGTSDSAKNYHDRVSKFLTAMPEVDAVSFCSNNVPFSNSNYNTGLTHDKKTTMSNFYVTENDYQEVLQVKVLEGRWYGKEDNGAKYKPIVINETLRKEMFGNEPVIGKVLSSDFDGISKKIVGVVRDFKDKGDFYDNDRCFFEQAGTDGIGVLKNILVKFKNPQGAAFEAKLHRQLSNLVKDANIEIAYLTALRESKNKMTIIPMIILIVVCSFLVFNVSLGLFGVLWYNINKRKSEIGLRRAVGATAPGISRQFISEAMVLTTLALLLGCFFAVQFPILNVFDVASGVYLVAILLTVLFIYALVLFCAYYPGKQAAKIYPAVALHED